MNRIGTIDNVLVSKEPLAGMTTAIMEDKTLGIHQNNFMKGYALLGKADRTKMASERLADQ